MKNLNTLKKSETRGINGGEKLFRCRKDGYTGTYMQVYWHIVRVHILPYMWTYSPRDILKHMLSV